MLCGTTGMCASRRSKMHGSTLHPLSIPGAPSARLTGGQPERSPQQGPVAPPRAQLRALSCSHILVLEAVPHGGARWHAATSPACNIWKMIFWLSSLVRSRTVTGAWLFLPTALSSPRARGMPCRLTAAVRPAEPAKTSKKTKSLRGFPAMRRSSRSRPAASREPGSNGGLMDEQGETASGRGNPVTAGT